MTLKDNYLVSLQSNNKENKFFLKDRRSLSNETLDFVSNIGIFKDNNIDFSNVIFSEVDTVSKDNLSKTLDKYYQIIDFWPNKNDTVGKCKIKNLIGKGQTSNVYHAIHEFLGIDVALKILSKEFKETDESVEKMFLQEARHTAKLNHKNLVSIFDAEKNDKYTYMVMEYIDGVNLDSIIKNKRTISMPHAIEIILNLADVLEYSLENNIMHRDIKPANIMISKDGRVKLLDLGLSIGVSHTPIKDMEFNGLVGTPHYMSPEQILNPDNIDHRADMYSIGATFYHLLTGKTVFDTYSLKELIRKSIDSDYSKEINSSLLDPAIRSTIMNLLKKDPNERTQTYKDLKRELFAIKKVLMSSAK